MNNSVKLNKYLPEFLTGSTSRSPRKVGFITRHHCTEQQQKLLLDAGYETLVPLGTAMPSAKMQWLAALLKQQSRGSRR